MEEKSVWLMVAEQELRHQDEHTDVPFWQNVIKSEQAKINTAKSTTTQNVWKTVVDQEKKYGKINTYEVAWGPDVGNEKIE